MRTRRIGPSAAGEVLTVVHSAFGARRPLDPPADALAESEVSLARALSAAGGLLIEEGGVPVGALVLDPVGETVFLRRFGVVPRAQGHGVAHALVEAALHACVGSREVAVLAREELPETIEFWEGQGFARRRDQPPYVELARPLDTSFEVPDADAMRELGQRVALGLGRGDLLVLSGQLGAGKTTFTQGLGAGLEVRGDVTSPTFVIARVHPSLVDGPDLVHVDAYRLGGIAELDDLDLDTSLDDAVTVVEWGEGLAEGLADSRLDVHIERAVGGDDVEDHDPRRVSIRRVNGASAVD